MALQNLTRSQLYELVWAQPATMIAKHLGVSDVWISKVCKRANIPKPPPGYWRAIAVGKAVKRPALPPLPPLQPDNMVLLGNESSRGFYPAPEWNQPKTDDEPIPPLPPPHVFPETMDAVKKRAELLTATLKFRESLKSPHPATLSLLNGDERRADRDSYFYKPRFRHPSGLALLTALNQLFAAWTSLGAPVSVSGVKNQTMSVVVLGYRLHFLFIDYQWDEIRVSSRGRQNGLYGFTWGYCNPQEIFDPRSHSTYREYNALTPDVLRSLVTESIVRVEEDIRSHAEWAYKRLAERRDEFVQSREERRLAAIHRHQKEVQQLIQSRINLMEEASSRIAHAGRLQSLIDAFDQKLNCSKQPISGYEKWRRWAMEQVNETDPRNMSVKHLEQWIAKFHLHD